MVERVELSVNADPPRWLLEKQARILNCSVAEVSKLLWRGPDLTPKEDPLLPGLLPE